MNCRCKLGFLSVLIPWFQLHGSWDEYRFNWGEESLLQQCYSQTSHPGEDLASNRVTCHLFLQVIQFNSVSNIWSENFYTNFYFQRKRCSPHHEVEERKQRGKKRQEDALLLALTTEEGATSQRMQVYPEAGKGKGMDSPFQPPEGT